MSSKKKMYGNSSFNANQVRNARSRDKNFTANDGQTFDEFEPICLGNYRYW